MQPTYFPNADITLLKVYDMPVIERAFSSIANDWEIEFNFPQGGCQQRAQIMSMILQKKFNIEHCKIWLFSPAALYLSDTRTFYTEDKNRLSPDNKVEWNYHVAPVVQVQSGNTIDTLVLIRLPTGMRLCRLSNGLVLSGTAAPANTVSCCPINIFLTALIILMKTTR